MTFPCSSKPKDKKKPTDFKLAPIEAIAPDFLLGLKPKAGIWIKKAQAMCSKYSMQELQKS
jgi:hypothetical protein